MEPKLTQIFPAVQPRTIGVARISLGQGVHFFPHKVDDFLVVVLNTQAKTAKLTTPTPQTSLAQQKVIQKLTYCSPGEGVHLQLT